ncbi:MAG: hypothetical protein RPU34_05905 [Candidatus Sedimenticola sp. (ex Thyasira tokunagai)]
MNIVVVDGGGLAGEADFPEINLGKFGWIQYPRLESDQVPEKCWRSDVIISVFTPITQEVIDKAFKLKLIAVAGDAYDHIDMAAAQARGISVCNTPGLNPADPSCTQKICGGVVDNINAFLKGGKRNLVSN